MIKQLIEEKADPNELMNWDIKDVQLDGQHTALSLAAALSTRHGALKSIRVCQERREVAAGLKSGHALAPGQVGKCLRGETQSLRRKKGTALMTAARFGNHEVVPILAAGVA